MSQKSPMENLYQNIQENFSQSDAVLSYEDYLKKVEENPQFHVRNSAQYFCDMIDDFGSYAVKSPIAQSNRYSLFDAEFLRGHGRVLGQEKVQSAIINHLRNFARMGKIDKLILLHGPNGSSKTSIVQALTFAAEHYSKSRDGAIYQFSWVFPRKESSSGGMGFSRAESSLGKKSSYATLKDEELDCRLPCDFRDHPLLLIPKEERRKLLESWKKESESPIKIPFALQFGDLSHRNRLIFDTLLSFYQGNLYEVYRHVRVERFYFSRRYRKGIAVVEPQLSVDATIRQLTNDQSLYALPNSLKNLSLYEVNGPLAEGNRGLIEYSDLLKRPIDAWKYLLEACEHAQVGAQVMAIFLDSVLIATSNESHLAGFREYPDWASFKGRIELIRVPYLLRSVDEAGIYHQQMFRALDNLHIAPHAIEMAARFAVLTRLEPPSIQKYPKEMEKCIGELTPSEKLDLYNDGQTPKHLGQKESQTLRNLIPKLAQEYAEDHNYEGRYGASPREILVLLMNAAQDKRFDHLCAGAVFDQIEQLIEQKSSYEFLRREPIRGFRDAAYHLRLVKDHYAYLVEDEVRRIVNVCSEDSSLVLFKRYVLHVRAWTQKEQFFDPVLQKSVDADLHFMEQMEAKLLAFGESGHEYRQDLMAQIAAAKIENPGGEIDYLVLFKGHLNKIREKNYAEQKNVVLRIIKNTLQFLENQDQPMNDRDLSDARILHEGLIANGYTEQSAKWALAFLLKRESEVDSQENLPKNLHFPGML